MSTTQAERDAKAAIEAAIEQYRAAFRAAHPEAANGMLGDWVVIAAETTPDEDPEEDQVAYSFVSSVGQPWYRTMGLIAAGSHFYTHNVGPEPED